MKFCKCHTPLTIKKGLSALKDEIIEFVEEPSMDELSDVVYCLNRLAGAIVKKTYIKIVPGDKLHIAKIKIRMRTDGCIRSPRHFINGHCPSEK
jgi:hypothetical protein